MTKGTPEFFGERLDRGLEVIRAGQSIQRTLEPADLTGRVGVVDLRWQPLRYQADDCRGRRGSHALTGTGKPPMPSVDCPRNIRCGESPMSKAKLSRRGLLAALAASPAAVEFLRSAIAEAQTSLSQSGLVGEIQGPTIITDPAKWPKKFARPRCSRSW